MSHGSEAGHADFAPLNELQDELLVYLRRTFGRVSVERVVSGPGLERIFSFLQESKGEVPTCELLEASRQLPETAEVIGDFAISRRDPVVGVEHRREGGPHLPLCPRDFVD